MDNQLLPRGVERGPLWKFSLLLFPWVLLLGWGLYAVFLCLAEGLNQTNMDNRFAFGLWIYLDLTVIALGAGAFSTGFLLYILKRHELKAVINSAVVLGLICYSGAVAILMVDVGQPLRAWFTYWHPNTHSMLTEVTFCLTCYLIVLLLEYVPIVLKNRKLRQIPSFLVFEFEFHKVMPVLAGVGTVLSFFHQGSLGGLYGVMRGRPFAFREEIGLWPSTFFLFVLSAIAAGPSFVLLTTWVVERVSGKRLVKRDVLQFLGRLSGMLIIVYVLFKTVDTLIWINSTSPASGFPAFEYYERKEFGTWILLSEIILFGLIPGLVLMKKQWRSNLRILLTSAAMIITGVTLNRFVMTIQTLALPTLSFDQFLSYVPSWQEVAAFAAVLAYGVLLYAISFRYFPLFPQEREIRRRLELPT